MTHHPHIHMILPGGGISPDGRWISSQPAFLLPVRVLGALFRRLFMTRLIELDARRLPIFGKLAGLSDRKTLVRHLGSARRKRWVVYAKAPFAGPEAVLAYLSRYTHRVAISNSRIVRFDGKEVTFRYKDCRRAGTDRQQVMTLFSDEFIRCFLIHVLLCGFHLLISHDPEGILVPEALAGADAVVMVPPPDLAVIRKAIRAITGEIARGLAPADIEGLTISDLITSIRPGLSARQCIANLRRASAYHLKTANEDDSVPLEKLGLTKPVADWAYETLGIMHKVAEGQLKPKALRFACLEGPPGTGKSTVAQALATSAGWAFVSTSVGDWFASSGGNLGDVIRAARLFIDEMQMMKKPVVGLLDEIDALPNRAGMDADRASWWSPVVTYVLTEIDKLRKAGKPILLLGATNHFARLDVALVRPGRLEKRISVLMPDLDDRKRLFAGYVGDKIGDSEIATLARLAVVATPAQIESWCASAMAKSDLEQRPLKLHDLIALIAPVDGRSPQQDRAVAIHEAGHAIAALELGLPVAEISILSMGAVGGWVNTTIDEHDLVTRDRVQRIGSMILGGRAADILLGNGAHGGAASDIEAVNVLLRTAMLDFGLYGSLNTGANADLRDWHGGVSLWTAIKTELACLQERATEIVERRADDIFALVDVLLSERVVTGERLQEILAPNKNAAVIASDGDDMLSDDQEQGRPA